MLNHLRWIIPLLLVALVAAYFVVGPMAGAHAAGVTPHTVWPFR